VIVSALISCLRCCLLLLCPRGRPGDEPSKRHSMVFLEQDQAFASTSTPFGGDVGSLLWEAS